MRVLTWNLFHGRAVPDRRGSLLREFAARSARLGVGRRAAAGGAAVVAGRRSAARPARARAWRRTSRNLGMPVRRAIAAGAPGADGLVGRRRQRDPRPRPGDRPSTARRALRWRPERRVVHGVRLGERALGLQPPRPGAPRRARAGRPRARRRLHPDWAGDAPIVLGGDFNLRGRPTAPGFAPRRRQLRRPRRSCAACARGRARRPSTAATSPTTRRCGSSSRSPGLTAPVSRGRAARSRAA